MHEEWPCSSEQLMGSMHLVMPMNARGLQILPLNHTRQRFLPHHARKTELSLTSDFCFTHLALQTDIFGALVPVVACVVPFTAVADTTAQANA